MIDRKSLLTALQRWVKTFENDLRWRCREVPELDASLRASYAEVKDANRTAESYETWRDGQLTQAAVNWVLACVFVRFLEDNELLDHPWIAAAGDRRVEAEHVRDGFFNRHPTLSDRDYLEHVFTEIGKLPGMADLFDRRHNPLWRAGISGDAAGEFIAFWRKLEHDFTDPAWDTRFLGDLYQDLSEAARKQFALLQTPEFIEEFILDRTLEPAIDTFGYEHVRMIDPACGSGHFVLGGFARLLRCWQEGHPELNEREVVLRALEGVAGVDINPFAIAIARFRLLLAAWRACDITRLRAAPDFRVNLAVGDSLLHGRRFREFESGGGPQRTFDTEELFRDELKHHYDVEDPEALHRILGRQYHAVVGNPPYITVKDSALSEFYRARYLSCSGKYSLSVPFMERFFDLALKCGGNAQHPAGFVGQITSNSFMKREFGKKLIEEFLPREDLTHVLDTSG
ncbi:MAG TPA: BREX-2 system adenine-specific DNA-methyltransferase PglX, partial [Chthoniobacterales bacterium]